MQQDQPCNLTECPAVHLWQLPACISPARREHRPCSQQASLTACSRMGCVSHQEKYHKHNHVITTIMSSPQSCHHHNRVISPTPSHRHHHNHHHHLLTTTTTTTSTISSPPPPPPSSLWSFAILVLSHLASKLSALLHTPL